MKPINKVIKPIGEDLSKYFCPNEDCPDYGIRDQGSISTSGHYGKDRRRLLRCRRCGERFSVNRSTPFFRLHLKPETIRQIVTALARGCTIRTTADIVGVSKDTVWRVFNRASCHSKKIVDNLLGDLHLEECQLDELWSFCKKNRRI